MVELLYWRLDLRPDHLVGHFAHSMIIVLPKASAAQPQPNADASQRSRLATTRQLETTNPAASTLPRCTTTVRIYWRGDGIMRKLLIALQNHTRCFSKHH